MAHNRILTGRYSAMCSSVSLYDRLRREKERRDGGGQDDICSRVPDHDEPPQLLPALSRKLDGPTLPEKLKSLSYRPPVVEV